MPLFTGPNQGREHQGWSITEAHRGSSTLLCRHVAPILIIQCPASCLIWYLYFTSSLNFSNLLKRHILIFIHVCYFLSRMIWKVLDPLPPSVLHCPWISGLVTIACRKYVAPLPAFLYAKATSTEHILMSFQLVIFSFKWTYRQYKQAFIHLQSSLWQRPLSLCACFTVPSLSTYLWYDTRQRYI